MSAEWEKSAVQELDVTATDLSTECLIDILTRIPSLRWLSAGQLDGFTDAVSVVRCQCVCFNIKENVDNSMFHYLLKLCVEYATVYDLA